MKNRPNVLFIYPDQMRYDVMGNTGNPLKATPAIDRLAQEGISFTNAYTSYPLCCPFRGSIMTGKYAHKHGLYANHYPISLNQEFLPGIMSRNGYSTGWIGKWHLNGGRKQDFVERKMRCGFDSFVGYSRGHSYKKSIFYRDDDRTPRRSNDYECVYQTRHLFEYIDGATQEEKPFFAGLCYGIPHPPMIAPEKYLKSFAPGDVPISSNVPKGIEEEARVFTAHYYGLVKMLDEEIGKIIDGLEKRNLAEDTLLIFVSDHGEMAGEHGIYKKIVINESSMHVPFIIRYPAKFKAATVEGIVDPSVDIFPTILDICGIDIPEYADGISLKEQCEQVENALTKSHVYFQNIRQPFDNVEISFPASRGIRTLDYCYREEEVEPAELYDLRNDPLESNNLVDSETHSDLLAGLREKVRDEMKRLGDSWNIQYDHTIEDYQSDKAAVSWGETLFDRAVLDD